MKNESQILQDSPSGLKIWVLAARPKTLIAGMSPVLIAANLASLYGSFSFLILSLCLLFSLILQIATNWANDYFDAVKGADTKDRLGPARAVQSGWILPKTMFRASLSAFTFAAVLALPLLQRIGIAFLPLLILCLLAGVFYTGGKTPLGYLGLGDLLVLIFYGPVAVSCTALALLQTCSSLIFLASFIPGLFSCALLAANNLRDQASDSIANKKTLVVRFGRRFGQIEYLICLLAVGVIPLILVFLGLSPMLLSVWLLFPEAKSALKLSKDPLEYSKLLPLTAKIFTIYTILFCLSIHADLFL